MGNKQKHCKKAYQKPVVKSEKEANELSMNCPSTNVRHCGVPFTPKKG